MSVVPLAKGSTGSDGLSPCTVHACSVLVRLWAARDSRRRTQCVCKCRPLRKGAHARCQRNSLLRHGRMHFLAEGAWRDTGPEGGLSAANLSPVLVICRRTLCVAQPLLCSVFVGPVSRELKAAWCLRRPSRSTDFRLRWRTARMYPRSTLLFSNRRSDSTLSEVSPLPSPLFHVSCLTIDD